MKQEQSHLAPGNMNPALLGLGRELAKACLKRAAEIGDPDLKALGPVPMPKAVPQNRRQTATRLPAQVVEGRDRVKARQLIAEGLRLIPPEERRGFFDLAVKWVEYFDQRREPPAT
jgi:hypothetical protein